MKLNLKRPLAFFDLETTGINVASDRIVEISIIKIHVDGSEEIKTLLINPGIPIPLESSLIHGIYDQDVSGAPVFSEVAAELMHFLNDTDLAGYNSNRFDIPLLVEEFLRIGLDFDLNNRRFVDIQNIFHQMEQRTLKAAYQFYCGKSLEKAHSAEADTRATYEVFLAQLKKYQDVEWQNKKGEKSKPIQNDVEALHDFSNLNKLVDFAGRMVYNDAGVVVFNFGKYKNRSVEEVFNQDPGYYSWMQQGDFPIYTKRCLEKIWTEWSNKKQFVKQAALSSGKKKPAKTQQKAMPIDKSMLEQLRIKFSK